MKILRVLKDKPPLSPISRLVETAGQRGVWKDYAERSVWVKDTWGKILINHESYILKRLAGLAGIPGFIRPVGDYGFLSEYIEGKPLADFTSATLPREVFTQLNLLVERIHKRGVVHLDLGQKRNILIGQDGQPYFLDFANALYFRPDAFGLGALFRLLCRIDRNALLKARHRFFPETLTPEEKRQLRRFLFIRRFWIFKPKKFRQKDQV